MRQLVYRSFAIIVMMVLLEGCAAVLSSHALQPSQPHVVLLTNDTIYARSVVVEDRFLTPKIVVDDKIFTKSKILYTHTNWGHRYYVIHNQMIEQTVSGRIDVFSKGINLKQDKPWKINDSGLRIIKTLRPEYVRKLPSQGFLKPDNPTLFSLVSDYEPAYRHMQQATLMRSYGIASAITSSALAGTGVVLLIAGAFDHTNPNSGVMQTIGLSSMAAGGLTFSVAFPTFMLQYKRHRVMAIETYNRGNF